MNELDNLIIYKSMINLINYSNGMLKKYPKIERNMIVRDIYNINYGLNYFPKKEYKGITYKEGYYESLVVTIGDGKGDNWWCVLFPPFCLIENDKKTDVEYRLYIKDMLEKYF